MKTKRAAMMRSSEQVANDLVLTGFTLGQLFIRDVITPQAVAAIEAGETADDAPGDYDPAGDTAAAVAYLQSIASGDVTPLDGDDMTPARRSKAQPQFREAAKMI